MFRLFLLGMVCALVAGCGGIGRNDLSDGAAIYASECAVCHGGNARGGGGGGVAGLSKTPPDLTGLRLRNGGSFPVYETLETVEGYAQGGMRGRQMAGIGALQSDRKKRARIDRRRIRSGDRIIDMMVFLESVQRP
ncbi:hypothetical protein ROLI_028890 [Roseobacter fucihabitans]|uniref:Cytochrome c domain-containing protein n=1 Tax=Roseobacter fucihabitans TaxID=1537242 RepID=A0ABZ2BYL1_9RHOB|nr:c-type cytochrome [Roseobacter litoralis]MBC6964807.1 hypothetical protein [Roseobacter litoralis]